LHNYEGSNWEIIPDDRGVQNADGTVDVTFDSLSHIAFEVDSTETDTSASIDADAPTSPQPGDSSLPPVAGARLIALGCVALASAAVVWKKRAQNYMKFRVDVRVLKGTAAILAAVLVLLVGMLLLQRWENAQDAPVSSSGEASSVEAGAPVD